MGSRTLTREERRVKVLREELNKRTRKEVTEGKYFENKREENVIHWCTFYRRNIHRFATDYLGLGLYLFQMIALYIMNMSPMVVLLCARAFSKSFVTAVYSICVCLLYPRSKVICTAYTKKQASLLIKEKIQKELLDMSPRLREHIIDIKTSQNEIEVLFDNGSSFIACVCGEQSRGIRSTVMICDEFRLVDKSNLESIIQPTEIARPVPYLKLPKWSDYVELLQEEPRELYLSSAYYKSNWLWNHVQMAFKNMYSSKSDEEMKATVLCSDYELTIHHGIKTREQMRRAKQQCDDDNWLMEYCNICIGGAEGQYYTWELVSKAQQLKKAWYPMTLEEYYSSKQKGYDKTQRFGYIEPEKEEVRIISMDVAIAKSTSKKKNDFTDIKCIRAIRKDNKYLRYEVYSEGHEGMPIWEQARRLNQIYEDFSENGKIDTYIVVDGRTYGTDLIDELARKIYDEERNTTYLPMKVFNDDCQSAKDLAIRCKDSSARPCIYAFVGDSQKNHIMHTNMKESLLSGKFKSLKSILIIKDEFLRGRKEYVWATGKDKVRIEAPYLYSDLTLNEMINLSRDEAKPIIKLEEPSTGTKDKYIARAMGNYFITNWLEIKLTKKKSNDLSDWVNVTLVSGYKQSNRY
jgi:hypothetical protein